MVVDFLHSRCLRPEWRNTVALRLPGAGLSIRYGGLAAAAAALAEMLSRNGIGRGARIALAAPPSLDFAAALFAASRLGAAVAPLDVSLRGMSLDDALARLAPDAVIGPAALLSRLPQLSARVMVACDHTDGPAIRGTLRRDGATVPFHISAASEAEGAEAAAIAEGSRPEDDLLLIATSGSTGRPKFVRLGHRGTLFNIGAHLASFDLDGPFRALQALGGNYSYGLIPSFLAPLTVGGTVALPSQADARGLCAAIEAESPAVSLMTPALIEFLIDSCTPDQLALLGRLEKLGIGGDACPERVRRKISQAMPRTAAYATYGATEAGPRIATLAPGQFLARPSSAGLPLPGVEIAVTDEHGQPAAAGTVGRLMVRTPSRMNGYLGENAAETASDWQAIGDMASLDADGYLTIHGRADRAFKHRGRLLNPAQIESVLARFPGVIAARIEVAAGEKLQAVIHYRPGGQDGDMAARLRLHCRRNLPNRLVPHEIVTIAEEEAYFFKGKSLRFSKEPASTAE